MAKPDCLNAMLTVTGSLGMVNVQVLAVVPAVTVIVSSTGISARVPALPQLVVTVTSGVPSAS